MQIPKPNESGTFELTPAGTFVATCFKFIDRGTQINEFKGERKMRREVMLTWELADEFMEDGRPFAASKIYTWSMHEKATLRHDLEAWRGRAFTNDDFDGPNAFNTKKLLGVPCMLTITHGKTEDGRDFAKITSIGKLMKGIKAPPLVNPITYLALTNEGWDPEVYNQLSPKTKEIIAGSPEYKDLLQKAMPHDDHGNGAVNWEEEISDAIPF